MGLGAERAMSCVLDDKMDFDDLLAHTEAELAATHGTPTGHADDLDQPWQTGLHTGFEFVSPVAGSPAGQGGAEAGGYGLLCSVREQGEDYLLRFVFDPRQLSAETAADWLEYYGRFLEGIIEGMA